MSAVKKKKTPKTFKGAPEVVIVTRTIVSAKDTLFPEKLKKANEILSKTVFMDEGPKFKDRKK